MGKRRRTDPETLERWEREEREFEELMRKREERFARADAREAAYRARLRKLSFGLLGREPAQPTA